MKRPALALLAAAGLALTGCAGQPDAAPVTVTETVPATTSTSASMSPAPQTSSAEPSESSGVDVAAESARATALAEEVGLKCAEESSREGAFAMPAETTVVCNWSKAGAKGGTQHDALVIVSSSNVSKSMDVMAITQDPETLMLVGDSVFLSSDPDVLELFE